MAASVTHNLCVKVGEYQAQGEKKSRWQRIGSVFKHDDGGTSIKLDCVPVGIPSWDGWVSVFRNEQTGSPSNQNNSQSNVRQMNGAQQQPAQPQARQGRQAPAQSAGPSIDFDDDIPF